MSPSKTILVLAVCLIAPSFLFCQTAMFDPGTQALCQKVKDVAVPPADLPTADEIKALTGCKSQDYYFGLGVQRDPVRARKCAFAEIEHGVSDLDIRGRAILVMIYANAQGVERNMDLAIKLTCAVQGSPGDVAGNVHQLARYQEGHYNGATFSFCDHSGGRRLYEQCAILDDRFDKIKREAKIAEIIKPWPAADKKAFAVLRQAADRFFSDRVAGEFDTGTTQVQERAFLEDDFIAKLQQLEQGDFPNFVSDDLEKSEARLKADLDKVHDKGSFSQGQITAQNVNKAEQSWLAYKEAWVVFGKKKYPKVTAVSWNTWFTNDRVVMLDKFL